MPDLTTHQVAEEIQRKPETVATYARTGRLPGAYKDLGGDWRIPREALDAITGDRTSMLAPRNRRSTAQQRRAA